MTMSEARSSVCPKMNIQEQIDFLRGPLHDGVVTKSLHYAALLPLIGWVVFDNFWLLGLAFLLPEAGHIYDFLFKFNAHMRARARQVVWLQIVASMIAFIPYLLVYLALHTNTFG